MGRVLFICFLFPPLWISMRREAVYIDRAWDLSFFLWLFTTHKSVSMVFIFHILTFFCHHLSSVYTLYLLGFLFLAGSV